MRFYDMKKLTLLLSSTIIFHLLPEPITTTFGPIQFTTPSGLNTFTGGTITFYGEINIGNSITDTITIQGENITKPSSGNNNLLMIDYNGNIIATNTMNSSFNCGEFSAASNAGQNISLGNSTGKITLVSSDITNPTTNNNSLLMIDSSGNIITSDRIDSSFTCGTITTGAISCGTFSAGEDSGQTITLGNNSGSITISSSGITNPSSGNNSLLMINSSGNVITSATTNSAFTCGVLTPTSISTSGTLSAGTTTLGSLTAASTAGQTVALGNSTGTIALTSSGITNPSSGNNSLLMINSSGNVITSATTNSAFTCGTLTPTSISTSGTLSAATTTLGNTTVNSLTTNGALNAGTTTLGSLSAATISGQTITLGMPNTSCIEFSSDINVNNMNISSTGQMIFNTPLGFNFTSYSAGNNYPGFQVNTNRSISLTSGTASITSSIGPVSITSVGIILSSPSTIPLPSNGNSQLYINSNGSVVTTTSSSRYKENINNLNIDNNTFELLQPVSFNYINDNQKHIEYGFIAEDLEKIPSLQSAVIYGKENTPLSINYQAVFVALTADYLKTKKELQKKLDTKDILFNELTEQYIFLENQLKNTNEVLAALTLKYTILESILAKIGNRINS